MPSDLDALITEYKRAESAIKETERLSESLCIPSVNELRMALFHLLTHEGLPPMSPQGIEAAIRHCKRAYYDAREMETAALCNASYDILKSIKGYARVVAPVFPSYHDLKNAAIEARATLLTAQDVRSNGGSREKQFDLFDQHRDKLREFTTEYQKYSDDIQEAISHEKWKNILLLLGGVLTLFGLFGAILKCLC